MLEFSDGVWCDRFAELVGRAVHFAATYAELAGVTIAVVRLGEDGEAVWFEVPDAGELPSRAGDRRAAHLDGLADYLTRTLGPTARVRVDRHFVHVDYADPGQR